MKLLLRVYNAYGERCSRVTVDFSANFSATFTAMYKVNAVHETTSNYKGRIGRENNVRLFLEKRLE